MLAALGTLLVISISLNLFQFFKTKKLKPTPTLEAEQLLHDLTKGSAIVKVEVIDPTNLILWNPR